MLERPAEQELDSRYALSGKEVVEVKALLEERYDRVFTDMGIDGHLASHVGFAFAGYACEVVAPTADQGQVLLDVGSGFGSWVLAAREMGLDARGVEIEEADVHVARARLLRADAQADPGYVFVSGDVREMDGVDETVDIVTFWNVLEHIDDYVPVLRKAHAMLRPGGVVYIICPNYAARRLEAHYHVPWYPLMPRRWASRYLRRLGRNPHFFETSIFYRTNWGVIRTLRRLGFSLYDIQNRVSMDLNMKNLPRRLWHLRQTLDYYNPFRESVVLAARKRG